MRAIPVCVSASLALGASALLICSCVASRAGSQPEPIGAGEGSAQRFDYASYRPYTLAAASRDHPEPDSNVDVSISGVIFKYRVAAEYVGDVRPLRDDVRRVLLGWGQALSIDPAFTNRFQQEVLFREGDAEHWLPIQEPVLPYLRREVRPGGRADLYVMFIGATRLEHVFLLNDFQTAAAPAIATPD